MVKLLSWYKPQSLWNPIRSYAKQIKPPHIQNFQYITLEPTKRMIEKLYTGKHNNPSFNYVTPTHMKKLTKRFVTRLDQRFEEFMEQPKPEASKDVTLANYLNPNWDNIIEIICAINDNHIPKPLVDDNGFKDKSDLVEWIVTKLFEKHFVEQSAVETPVINKDIDFSNPAHWFPEARKMKRKIILHVGPTNSGKTYASLKQLEKAKSGYYAGPLRLLAREIFEKFNKHGISCNLLTGEEIIPVAKADGQPSQITSGTIEMIPLNKRMDLCIIDEIQMISDEFRGEAWTNALLGVQAKEIHVCGEERAVNIVKSLTKLTGDELVINRYERLGKLEVEDKPLKGHRDLKPGDCIVTFSKRKILQLKVRIESETNMKVAVIYGALPPEIRSEQAAGFNEGKYDILVASDAVGMGLNLAIKRIIFSTVDKFNGFEMEQLSKSALRQIAGRAGRFSHDKKKLGGKINAFSSSDLKFIRSNMKGDIEDIKQASIWPSQEVWINYISKFPADTTMLSLFEKFSKIPIDTPYFRLTDLDARSDIMGLIATEQFHVQLPIETQLRLSIAPINFRGTSKAIMETTIKFLNNIIANESKSVMDFDFLPLALIMKKTSVTEVDETLDTLTALEQSHKMVLLFMWLSQRWPNAFVDLESAYDWKVLIEKRISDELVNLKRRRRART